MSVGEAPTRRADLRFRYRPPGRPATRAVTVRLTGARPDDRIAEEIRRAETFYEIDLLEHLADHVPRGGTWVDVGANIGNHAVYFGRFLADRVVAIEPHPDLVPILRANLRRNRVAAAVLPCAVGAREGVGRMRLRPACALTVNLGGSHVEVVDAAEPGPAPVRITTLDRALAAVAGRPGSPVRLIKLDIEGMELAALEGAASLLAAERPQVVVELATAEARAAVRAFLAGFGYREIGRRFGWTPTFHFVDPRVHRVTLRPRRPPRDLDAWRLDRVSREMRRLIPAGATYVLVDDDQWWAGLVVDGRRRLPFCERDGQYWGRPADGRAAVRELERLRAAGARFLVFLWPSFWWLHHYPALRRHLARFERLLANERAIIFALSRARLCPSREGAIGGVCPTRGTGRARAGIRSKSASSGGRPTTPR